MQVFAATQGILQGAKLDEQTQGSIAQSTQQQLDEHNNNQVSTIPGSTVTNPLSYPGTKNFTDASWQQSQEQGNPPSPAGLGIFIHLGGGGHCTQLFISAISPPVSSALQAETYNMLLALTLVQHLQLQQVNFFTDCAVLAKAPANQNIIDSPGHWEIRPQLAELFSSPAFDRQKIYHIPRCNNFKADFQARLALRLNDRPFSFTCVSSTQANDVCSFRDTLTNSSTASCKLLYVKCY
uniref:Uncharacterized protein n=1 Tax=Avena sativa TaxID=4498 RepID=A0ACD5TJE1_AVESA